MASGGEGRHPLLPFSYSFYSLWAQWRYGCQQTIPGFMPKCLPWDYGFERGWPHLMTTFLYSKGSDQAEDNEFGEGELIIIVTVGQCHPLLLAIFISCLYGLRNKISVVWHELMPLSQTSDPCRGFSSLLSPPYPHPGMTHVRNGSFSQTHFFLNLKRWQKLVTEELWSCMKLFPP